MTEEPILTPPNNLDAERAVLGACIVARDAIEACEGLLHPGHFYHDAHGLIYQAVRTVAANGPVDLVTVVDELRRTGRLDAVGGTGYLAHLAGETPSIANAEYYARIVKEAATLRRMADVLRRGIDKCYTSGADPASIIGEIEASVLAVAEHRARKVTHVSAVTGEAVRQIKRGAFGLRFPWDSLTKATAGGMREEEYTLLLGYRKQGKTTVMLRMAYEYAKDGIPVEIFSFEMSGKQLARILLSWECGVPRHELFFVPDEDLAGAQRRIDELPIYVEDDHRMTTADMRAVARRAKKAHGIQWIGIDYASKVQPVGVRLGANEEVILHAVADQVKEMAKELKVPILLLHQVTREKENGRVIKRGNGSEVVSAKGCKHLENEAETVLVFSRPAAEIDPNTPDLKELETYQNWHGKALMHIDACRQAQEAGSARVLGWNASLGYPYELPSPVAAPPMPAPVQEEWEYGDPLADD